MNIQINPLLLSKGCLLSSTIHKWLLKAQGIIVTFSLNNRLHIFHALEIGFRKLFLNQCLVIGKGEEVVALFVGGDVRDMFGKDFGTYGILFIWKI
jgi:hypothetical protein